MKYRLRYVHANDRWYPEFKEGLMEGWKTLWTRGFVSEDGAMDSIKNHKEYIKNKKKTDIIKEIK